jgi:hypothetical protein
MSQPHDDARTRSMCGLVDELGQWWRAHRADPTARNLAYYRGNFWPGDGFAVGQGVKSYRSERNETHPVCDTLKSALGTGLPQVEALPQTAAPLKAPLRMADPQMQGRRKASVLNAFAAQDSLADTLEELILNAIVFDEGGLMKVQWSPRLGRVIWRTKLPWEFQIDPNAKRIQDASFIFEHIVLHIDDLRERVQAGVYDYPQRAITADHYPRTLVDDYLVDEDRERRMRGLQEYVGLVEFWDLRRGMLYHLHPDTRQCLMAAPIPYGNPYRQLVFHPAIGRPMGVSDVSQIAPLQRDINELVSARREMVARQVRRLLVSRALFRDDGDFTRFKNSRAWEATLIDKPAGGAIGDHVFVTPDMGTTADFREHLGGDVEHVRYSVGLADFQRGQARNIRTAAEVEVLTGAVENRLASRQEKIKNLLADAFKVAEMSLAWAAYNPSASKIDIVDLFDTSQAADASVDDFAGSLRSVGRGFRMLPFSPLMEDRATRRAHVKELMRDMAATPAAAALDWYNLAAEATELHGLQPNSLRDRDVWQAEDDAQRAAAAAPPPGPAAAGLPAADPMADPLAGGAMPDLGALIGGAGIPPA